jgi:peptidoglycan/LPS O-acetylase OafA/YrhL
MIATAAAYVVAGYALAFAARGTVLTLETWQYLGAFALGALAAEVSYGATAARPAFRRVPWHLLAAGCLAIIVGVTAACGWRLVDRHVAAFDLPMALATMAVLIGTSQPAPGILRRILQWRPLAMVGLFSYSLYIIHYPLADVLCQVIVVPIHNELAREAVLAGVVAPALIALAYGFYRLFEQPFHGLARRIGKPPKTDGTASAAVPSL